MARNRRRKRIQQRQVRKSARRQRRQAKRHQRRCPRQRSYRPGLKEAIAEWFPSQFFSHWRVFKGCRWSPLRVFWMAVLMVWSVEPTLQTRFDACREVLRKLFPKWPLGKTYTGWYEAQLKFLTPIRPALTNRLQQRMRLMAGAYWLREGWCAFAVDGSRVECPRTANNQRLLKCAGREKTGPQLFLTTLFHMGLGLPWDFRIGPGTDSERRHLEDMLANLPLQALVVADAGFTGYELFCRLQKNHYFLIRVGANVHLLRKLGFYVHEGADTVYLWPEKNSHEPPVVLRLIERRQGNKKMYLVTNVLDREALTDKNVATLYEMRWGVEVFYRSLKQTLKKRKMLSWTAEAAKCELTWTMYGMWLLGLLSVSKIAARGIDPLRWSVAASRDRIRESMRCTLRGRLDRGLGKALARTLKDSYVRRGSKKARDWPHKKNDGPPGAPKIQLATKRQRLKAQRVKMKNAQE